jgi:hypothetical protein
VSFECIDLDDEKSKQRKIKSECDGPKENLRKAQILVIVVFFVFVAVDEIIGKT